MSEPAQTETEHLLPTDLVAARRGRFSAELGIDVAELDDGELFKWLLAAVLFGARISERLAARTYRAFAERKLATPEAIIECGWNGLVAILDSGGYTRYDFKTATKLLNLSRSLLENYQGSLNRLHAEAESAEDLERRLIALAKGIGPTTVNIFLRELRGVWAKAAPALSELATDAAKTLGFLPEGQCDSRFAAARLQALWARAGGSARDFPDFETALVREGLLLRRAKAHGARTAH
ncbi:HhH-GDP family DNA glycosylase [Methylocaldum marinum]|nr:hypothetical protein [Methylocaldum marinum]